MKRLALAAVIAVAAGPLDARPFTRVDLAPAFLRFERAFGGATIDEPTFRSLDRRFDAFTVRAFMGDFTAAYVALNEMAADLALGRPRTTVEVIVDATAAEVRPRFLGPDGPPPALTLRSVVPIELDDEVTVEGHVELALEDGAVLRGPAVRLVIDDLDAVDLVLPYPDAWLEAPRGDHLVRFVSAGYASLPRRLSIGDLPLDATRERLLARLDALDGASHDADAAHVCRDRAALLRFDPLGLETAILTEPPLALADAIALEIAALERGDDPYRGRADDHWRTFRLADRGAPARVFAPAAKDPAARPLLVALHGAGADENMFFRAYGDGVLKRLAREREFVVVTPRTEAMLRNERTLEELLVQIRADHAFDERRVYLLGHSMGAMTAARHAARDAERLAAVVCIAGAGSFAASESLAPTLVITGSEDRIVPAAGVGLAARAAIAAALPVELRVKDRRGHTLFVSRVLAEAFDWMETYSR